MHTDDTDELISSIPPVPGNFEPDNDLMHQLSLLTTENLAKKWWNEYLKYHGGVDQGVMHCIGYFANKEHRDNLYRWLKQ